MNKRKNTNTNLMPRELMIKYTYQKCMLPAIAIIVVSLIFIGVTSFGSEWLSNKLINKAEENKINSVYGENIKLENEITKIQEKISDKERIVQSMKHQNENMTIPISDNYYKIEKLINYINKIKPKNITIVLIEDDGTSIKDNSNEKEFALKYRTDIRSSGIQIRGFSTNKESLATFIAGLSEYEEMSNYKVNAVETVKILDDDLDVFDITIMPR